MNTSYNTPLTWSITLMALTTLAYTSQTQTAETTKKLFVPMATIVSMCKTLHVDISSDNFKPDLLVGLARGGLIPLGFLAGEGNFNNRNTRAINLQSYNDLGEKTELHLTSPISPKDFRRFKSILIIDDLADSGDSLDLVLSTLQGICKEAVIKTAVLFYKKHSKIKPDYYIEETADWIVFPWEV